MVQSTKSRKRSSGSSTRCKKSQRLIISPPKLPRLTIRPPKPPKGQLRDTIMVLRSPKLSLPVAGPIRPDWTEISLIGNGADASYDYDDICKVQAIMKAFNGFSSATRKIEAAEQKSSKNESVHIAMEDPGAASHMDDRDRAELEMNNILQEALDCNHCEKTMYLKPDAMESDVRHGIYRCGEDPPFFNNQAEEDVAPDEEPEDVWVPSYLKLATSAQHEQYVNLVEQYLHCNRAKRLFAGMENQIDQGYESQFALYCVDFHIHQHYLHRRSVLNYCRTNADMEDFRDWKHRLALWTAQNCSQDSVQVQDKRLSSEDEKELASFAMSMTQPIQIVKKEALEISDQTPFGSNMPGSWSSFSKSPASSIFSTAGLASSPSTAASTPPKASSFSNPTPPLVNPWPKQQLALSNQISLHRHLVSLQDKAARVRISRKRFREIMKKRAIQHRDGLIIANYEAAFALQKWQRGKEGPLAMQREGKVGELLKKYNR